MVIPEEVKRENDYCGITALHNQGYTGKGIVVWNMEDGNREHGQIVEARILHAAPEAKVLSYDYSCIWDKGKIEEMYVYVDGKKVDVEEFIRENQVNICTQSQHGGFANNPEERAFWERMIAKYNLHCFNAVGNTDKRPDSDLPQGTDIGILVGDTILVNGKVKDGNDGIDSDDLDFCTFRGMWGGTSFSCPYLAGQDALLRQKYGMHLTQDDIYQMFKSACREKEWTRTMGWGMPMLQDISEVEQMTTIEMTIGSNVMYVNGQKTFLEQAPIIDTSSNRTLVPIRAIAEAFGCDVEWDKKLQKITITGGEL